MIRNRQTSKTRPYSAAMTTRSYGLPNKGEPGRLITRALALSTGHRGETQHHEIRLDRQQAVRMEGTLAPPARADRGRAPRAAADAVRASRRPPPAVTTHRGRKVRAAHALQGGLNIHPPAP